MRLVVLVKTTYSSEFVLLLQPTRKKNHFAPLVRTVFSTRVDGASFCVHHTSVFAAPNLNSKFPYSSFPRSCHASGNVQRIAITNQAAMAPVNANSSANLRLKSTNW